MIEQGKLRVILNNGNYKFLPRALLGHFLRDGQDLGPAVLQNYLFQVFQNITRETEPFRSTPKGKPCIWKLFFAKYVVFLSD